LSRDGGVRAEPGRVNSARQAGKSILTRLTADSRPGTLRNLANHLGDKFVAGYVLYTGQQTLSYGSRIKAVPMDALWLLAP
jgi:hypothetical protein